MLLTTYCAFLMRDRWLSLLPAIDRLVYCWPAVKMYFLTKGEDYCRKEIWEFVSKGLTLADLTDINSIEFREGISEAYLYFIHNIMPEFNLTITALENDSCTITEVDDIMRKLMSHLKNRLKDKFYGSKNKEILKKMNDRERAQFTSETEQFLKKSIQYLEERYDFAENSIFKKLSILALNKPKNMICSVGKIFLNCQKY